MNVGPASANGQTVRVTSDVPFLFEQVYLAPYGEGGRIIAFKSATQIEIRGLDTDGPR